MNAYDEIYQQLLPRLKTCDLKKHAENLGLDYQNNEIKVDFMGEIFTVTNEGIVPYTEDGNAYHVPITLAYYVLSEGKGEPSENFVARHHLANTMTGMFDKTRITEPILIATQGDYKVFSQAAVNLKGKYIGQKKGGYFWVFDPLPKIPVGFTFIEADDELPAELLITVPDNATDFLEYECLDGLEGIIVERIRQEVRRIVQKSQTKS